jgi:hypothetical protein
MLKKIIQFVCETKKRMYIKIQIHIRECINTEDCNLFLQYLCECKMSLSNI